MKGCQWVASLLFFRFLSLPGEASSASLDGLNLLKNPGFEEGEGLPGGWGRHPGDENEGTNHAREIGDAFEGEACGRLTSLRPRPPGEAPIQWSQYKIEIEGDTDLWVSFRVKTNGDRAPWAGLHFYGPKKEHLGFHRIPCSAASSDWTEQRAVVAVPRTARSLGFVLYGHDQCTTWYDHARLLSVPEATIPRGTPKVDGERTDPCWKEAAKATPFYVHPGCEDALEAPLVSAVYDDRSLFLFLECPCSSLAGRDWKWMDLFLAPEGGSHRVYRLSVGRSGAVRERKEGDKPWTSKAQVCVKPSKEFWRAELALPLESLDLDLDVEDTWGFNVAVLDAQQRPILTWSPGATEAPARLGKISLSPDLSRFYRPDLRLRLHCFNREAKTLRSVMKRDNVGADSPAWERLRQAEESIEELGRAKDRGDSVAPGEWDGVREGLAAIGRDLEASQSMARSWPFSPESVRGSFAVSTASSLVKIHRTGPVPAARPERRVRLHAARDEEESFQLVVVAGDEDVEGLSVEVEPPGKGSSFLPVRWYRVDYVKTAQPCYETPVVGWWPDPLLPPGPVSVRAGERQPLWFTVTVPPDARPGRYKGQVSVRGVGLDAFRVPLEVRVWDFQLPRPGRLAAPFGLYAHALSNWYYGTAPYSEAMPVEQFAEWCAFMGRYRLTPKNIAREYLGTVRSDGETVPDLSRLQETLQPLASSLYAPYSFCIYRLPSNHSIAGSAWQRDLPRAEDDFFEHVQAWEGLGLPSEAYVYGVDEPKPEQYPLLRKIYKRIKKRAPIYPIMQTIGDPYPKALEEWVDIWCPLTARLEGDFYANRVKAGDRLWTYVCCSPKPPYANFFVDQPATAHRALFWQVKDAGAAGLLYWCVCWWKGLPSSASGKPHFPEVPLDLAEADTYQSFKVNGDGLLLYPGRDGQPWPSLRLEVIRDGIEDYEYLALLEERTGGASDLVEVPDELSRSWTQYTDDPEVLSRRRRALGELIQDLEPRGNRSR